MRRSKVELPLYGEHPAHPSRLKASSRTIASTRALTPTPTRTMEVSSCLGKAGFTPTAFPAAPLAWHTTASMGLSIARLPRWTLPLERKYTRKTPAVTLSAERLIATSTLSILTPKIIAPHAAAKGYSRYRMGYYLAFSLGYRRVSVVYHSRSVLKTFL